MQRAIQRLLVALLTTIVAGTLASCAATDTTLASSDAPMTDWFASSNVGDLTVTDAAVIESPDGTMSLHFTIRHAGEQDDRLLGASVEVPNCGSIPRCPSENQWRAAIYRIHESLNLIPTSGMDVKAGASVHVPFIEIATEGQHVIALQESAEKTRPQAGAVYLLHLLFEDAGLWEGRITVAQYEHVLLHSLPMPARLHAAP